MPDQTEMSVELVRFRRRNRQFFVGTTLIVLAIVVILVVTLAAIVIKGSALEGSVIKRLILIWPPALFYLWGLWTLRSMFGALASGGLSFQPMIGRALAKVGWALLLGSLTSLVLGAFQSIMLQQGTTGWFASFNVPALTLGVVGLALIVLVHMLRRAARIEAILGDFV